MLHAGYVGLQIHTQNFAFYFSTATIVTRTHLNVTIYVHCRALQNKTTKTTKKKDKILDGTDLMDQPASLFLPATNEYLHKESVD
jgi:hypothetical protein